MRRAAPLLLALALAGCLAPAQPVAPARLALPLDLRAVQTLLDADHDHADPALHALGQGLDEAAWLDPLEAEPSPGQGAAWLSDIQFHGDLAYVAVRGGRGGFFVVDAAEPLHPRVLGRYAAENSDSWYVKVSPRGDLVYLTVRPRQDGNSLLDPLARGWSPAGQACLAGVQVVSVADPARPALAGCYDAAPRTVNVWAAEFQGQEVLFVVDRGAGQYGVAASDRVLALDVQRLPGDLVQIVPRGVVYTGPDRVEPQRALFVHDLFLEEHPLAHQRILYVANWDAGLALVDVTDLDHPRLLGRYDDPAPAVHMNIHTVKPHPGLLAGRHVTVAAPEPLGPAESDAPVRLLDTTDPGHIVQLATWRLDATTPEPYSFSPHDFTLDDGKLYLSYFHAGVWVLGLRDPEHPQPIAFAMPHERSAAVAHGLARYAPRAETAVLHAGLVWVSDMETGLYAYRLDA
jgi:hypothetical protein